MLKRLGLRLLRGPLKCDSDCNLFPVVRGTALQGTHGQHAGLVGLNAGLYAGLYAACNACCCDAGTQQPSQRRRSLPRAPCTRRSPVPAWRRLHPLQTWRLGWCPLPSVPPTEAAAATKTAAAAVAAASFVTAALAAQLPETPTPAAAGGGRLPAPPGAQAWTAPAPAASASAACAAAVGRRRSTHRGHRVPRAAAGMPHSPNMTKPNVNAIRNMHFEPSRMHLPI